MGGPSYPPPQPNPDFVTPLPPRTPGTHRFQIAPEEKRVVPPPAPVVPTPPAPKVPAASPLAPRGDDTGRGGPGADVTRGLLLSSRRRTLLT